jgi:hypothetical protein
MTTNQANGSREAERTIALMEGARNHSEHEYMKARPHCDSALMRRLFCDAFERGYQAALSSPQVAPESVGDAEYDRDQLLIAVNRLLCNPSDDNKLFAREARNAAMESLGLPVSRPENFTTKGADAGAVQS